MNLLSRLLDIIYPPRCPVCGAFLCHDNTIENQEAVSFCRTCLDDLKRVDSPLCPICSKPHGTEIPEDHLCEDCLRRPPFYEILLAAYLYEGAIMTAIHKFKYGSKRLLADSLGPLLAQFAALWIQAGEGLLTMPVPLHPKRMRQRGFNQSLLLARHVAKRLRVQLDFLCLRRVRYTQPQIGLKKDERRKNVRRAFHLTHPEAVKGKTILLIDDVATTGNTLNECARVLRRSGCKRVICLVLARAANY